MSVLLDTNLLTRMAEPKHPQNPVAEHAVRMLAEKGEVLHILPQNAYEFWVVATRPIANNGLGMSIAEAKTQLDSLLKFVLVLPETPAIFPQWQSLVVLYECKGKPAHDARIAAGMMVHRILRILTFNASDF